MERWYLRNVKVDLEHISNSLGISKLLAKIIVNRGIKDLKKINNFVYPDLEKLHNPRLMKDMDTGVNLMKRSIVNKERIRICGDYDQDGNSAILTLYSGIRRCGGNIDYVIPHRVRDGYGINERIVKEAKKDGIDLIITCDNGISAFHAIKLARDLGIKTIITDHHDISFLEDKEGNRKYILPEADAIINPKRPDCKYPFKELCGAGVAFKFIQVLYQEFDIDIKESYNLLEYVAMGTVCDVVDLIDENRIIVKEGLKRINKTDNIGLKALIKATGLENRQINTYSLGFILGPCVNASGRLDSAEIAVEMFLTKDPKLAQKYAEELYLLNEERKSMTEEGFKKVINQVEGKKIENNKVLVIYEPDTHESIVGIIAGRVKDRYYRPTILLTQSKDENIIKGSGRSIEEYNMFKEVSKCKELLTEFGGHPMAAGLSLDISNLDNFKEKLERQACLSEEELLPKVYIDVYLPLDYISFNLVEELKVLAPFGKGNPKPLFADKNLSIRRASILGKNQNVLKLLLISKSGKTIDGLYFGDIGEFENTLRKKFGSNEVSKMYKGIDNKIRIDIIYTPNINEYMGSRNLQVIIQNYR